MHFDGNVAAAVLAAGGQIWGPSIGDLTNRRVEEARAVGIPIHCWTVNRSDEIKKMMAWQLAGVTTDYPELAVRMAHRI